MIELIVLDVDGTMTRGDITYDSSGNEYKSFNVKDGLAIDSWKKLGKKVAIITGRNSSVVEKRAKELRVDYIIQGCKNKLEIVEKLADELNITLENIAAIGDDLNDLSMLNSVGLSFAPKDASHFVTSTVDIVVSKDGGCGAVREMIEIIVNKNGLKESFISLWL